jgi:adenosylcobyric acid synthase
MNPLLLKPEADTHSQVVLLGKVDQALTRMPWRERSAHVWPTVAAALDALRAQNDVVVIEGAGSPAEINLMDSDIVNLRVARHAQARCLLVTDIDRGGAFAHLYGTWALLPPEDRALIRGFMLNKFRGDPALLAPAPRQLEDMTGIPTVAVLPMWRDHGLPEEDGVFDDRATLAGPAHKTVAIVAYPRISNLDEFQALKNLPGVRLVWVRAPADLEGLDAGDWIVLPGSKHTSGDLAWLRAQGLDNAVLRHAQRGGAILGVCGGLQMLGAEMTDPYGIDGEARGLGLLSLSTAFAADKVVRRCEAQFGELTGCWAGLSGLPLRGYEIHHGQTHVRVGAAQADARVAIPGLAWQNAAGNVLGLYVHGLFEEPAVLRALLGGATLAADAVFEGLAQFLDRHVDPGVLYALIS